MTPWWLRPTAESKKNKDRKKDEPDATPQDASREAGAPEEPPEPSKDKSKGRRSSRSRGSSRKSGSSNRKKKEDPQDDASDKKGRRGGQSKDRRGGSGKSGKSDKSGKPDASGKSGKSGKSSGRSGRSGRSGKPGKSGKDSQGKQGGGSPEPAPHDITTEDIETMHRELFEAPGPGMDSDLDTVPERTLSVNDERKIAMFCDLENIALGVRDSDIKKFDINLVLERLLEKGKIIVKRAYCDWERYSEYKRAFHEAAIEMLDIPQKYYSGKNSADIKMVVDAMDLCYAKEHLDTFALLSGDSDFSPLVSKLKENDKYVIGIGVKNSSSALLVDNCDEFIYYEDVWRDRQASPELAGLNKKAAEAFGLMIDAIQALIRENKEVLWGSMVKQTMQRKRPSFNEGYYGYSSFSDLLEDAEKKNILRLKKDKRSGTYIVTGFAKR